MRNKVILIVIVAMSIGLIGPISVCVADVPALSNSNGGTWQYFKTITIHNSAGSLSNYQVLVEQSGSDFPVNAQTDGDDVRFTDANGNELSYCIESYEPGNNKAKIWVKVPSIPAGTVTLYMYYGNEKASAVSNGNAVFEFFDDFEGTDIDAGIWEHTAAAGGSYSVSNSHLAIYCDSSNCNSIVKTKTAKVYENDNVAIEMYGYETDYGFGSYHCTQFSCSGRARNYAQMPSGSPYFSHLTSTFQQDHTPLPFNVHQKRGIILLGSEGTRFQTELENGITYTDQTSYYNSGTGWGIEFYCYHAKFWIDWVRIRKYADPEPTVTISSGQSITTPTPTPTPVPTPTLQSGYICVRSDPSGADVYLDGVYQGVSTSSDGIDGFWIYDVSIGYCTIRLEKYGYEDYTETVSVTAGDTTSIRVTLTQEIDSTPTPISTSIPTQAPIGKPQITISQTSLLEEPGIGEEAMITVSLKNTGNGIARNVQLTERIPSSVSVSYVEGADNAGGLVSWSGDLNSGQSHSIQHTFRILEAKDRFFTAKVTYEDAQGNKKETSTNVYITTTTETSSDSDGDGWNDELEIKAGTNPYVKDTDNDGLWDSQDPNPLMAQETETPGLPGFKAVFAVMGLLVVSYVLRRMR